MRLLSVLVLLGALAAPAAAHRQGCHGPRHHRVFAGHHRVHRHHGYRRHAWRPCRPVRYVCYPRFYTGVAPLYTRLSATFLLDDPVFYREADADGLPQPRAEPVGARFLVKSAQ